MASMKMIKTMKAAKNMNRDVIIGILVLKYYYVHKKASLL